MNIVHLDEKTIKALVNFTSLEEMNEAVREHRMLFYLSPSDKEILFVISQYACKFKGVCYLSKQKIAEAAGFKSRRTAIRACNRLEKKGIIKQYETRRVRGDKRRSVNIIVIQQPPGIKKETLKSQQAVTSGSHNQDILTYPITKTPKKKDLTEKQQKHAQLESLKKKIPAAFFDVFSLYFDAQGIYDIYGILLRAKKKAKGTFLLEDYAKEYIQAFYNIYHRYFEGKIQNIEGYLFRTWESVTEKIKNEFAEIDFSIGAEPECWDNKKESEKEEGEVETSNWWEIMQEEKAAEREKERIKEEARREAENKERERRREEARKIAEEKMRRRARKREEETLRKAEERKLDIGEDLWQQVKEGMAEIEQLRVNLGIR